MPDRASIVLSRRTRRKEQQASRHRWRLMGGLGLGVLLSGLVALLILLAALAYADLTRDLPNVAILPDLLNPPNGLLLQPTRVYDRTGQFLLFTFDSAYSGVGNPPQTIRRYIPISPAAPQHLPDFLLKSTVEMLDPGFWSNGGYSLSGLIDPEAHPTIAQKLVSDLLLYDEPPSLRRALRERILAAQVISEYGRNQVLEWYLNSADYGNDAYGIDAAAEFYFGVSATDLTPAESALLAATSQAPDLNLLDAPDLATERGRTAVLLMQKFGVISADTARSALAAIPQGLPALPQVSRLRLDYHEMPFLSLVLHQLAPQLTEQRVRRGGLAIITTMDSNLQQYVSCATSYRSQFGMAYCYANQELVPSGSLSASIVLDPQTGQVLAVDSAALGVDSAGANPSITIPRDPGTLLAPFVYLTAFTRGFGPASLVWDIPSSQTSDSSLTGDTQSSIVNRQSEIYHGPVRMRIALANDYLAAGQSVAAQMGSDAIGRTEASFGLAGPQQTLLDMASAYGVFAAGGVRYGLPGPTAVLRIEGLDHAVWLDLSNPQAQPVVTPALAYLVNNVLSDESARWPSLGHPNSLEIGRPAGIKLGQSSDGSWGVGYTPSRVVAVWSSTSTTGTAGGQLPTANSQQLLSSLLQLAVKDQPADGWAVPPDVSTVDVCDPSGLLPTKDCPTTVSEVFLSGNEPVQTDTLFRTYTINRETGFLATVFTPPDLVQDKVFMIVPPEAADWAKSANIAVAPTSYDAIQAPPVNPDVRISTPTLFSDVTGKVQFRGTASGANFEHYRLVVGQGLNPQSWIVVSDSSTRIENGLLGTWDTTGLNGLYAVELQVVRTDQTIDTAITQVTVK